MSAQVMGASEVYGVDYVADRLRIAADLGAIAVEPKDGDPVEQIQEMRRPTAD